MNRKDIFNKFISAIPALLTAHAWYLAIQQQNFIQQQNKIDVENTLLSEKTENVKRLMSEIQFRGESMNTPRRLVSLQGKAQEALEQYSQDKAKFDITGDKYHLNESFRKFENMWKDLNESLKVTEKELELQEIITQSNSAPIAQPSSSDTATSIQNNISNDITDLNLSESNVLGPIKNLIDQYNEFLLTLSSEELGCLTNLFALILIFLCINSLTSIYYGDKLIKWFNLESKLPRVAKIIEYRRKFLTYYFTLNIGLIYLILFFFIWLNFYIFIRL